MSSEIFRADLLAGQIAIVSGGGSGLGRASALELASLGAAVVICGRREEPLAETVGIAGADGTAGRTAGDDGTAETGGAISHVVCDIREEDQVRALVDATLERHGRIDLLVNNAGGQFLTPAEDISPKGFRTVIRLNVEGTWLMSHEVATRAMIPARRGKIINITLSPHHGQPGMVHSAAARAAVENMARTLSIEWARFGVLVNAIAAGQFATDTLLTKYPQQIVDTIADTIPLGRLGRSEEIAWLVAFLASPAGDFTTGSVITVDGARDNHNGRWPSVEHADADGKLVAEQRRPKS